MYGKFFASTFTGSMFGAGPTVFSVWGYVIANTIDSRVELNPLLLASVLGAPPDSIEQAIAELCAPDPKSRNPAAEGRRLQREGQYQYRVTSHEVYRVLRNEDERRAYNRRKQRESRQRKARVKPDVIDSQQMSTLSAHTEAIHRSNTQKQKEQERDRAREAQPHNNGRVSPVLAGQLPRDHLQHSACSDNHAWCVPTAVHYKLRNLLKPKHGGSLEKAAAALEAWYPTVWNSLPADFVMSDAFKFWQPRFDDHFASKDTAVKRNGKIDPVPQVDSYEETQRKYFSGDKP